MTPFRKSQARSVLEGLVRWLAPNMQSPTALREALDELGADAQLWADVELARVELSQTAASTAASNANEQ